MPSQDELNNCKAHEVKNHQFYIQPLKLRHHVCLIFVLMLPKLMEYVQILEQSAQELDTIKSVLAC